jgi:hypothetical protein
MVQGWASRTSATPEGRLACGERPVDSHRMGSDRVEPNVIEVDREDDLPAALAGAGLRGGGPVLVVVGGAAGLSGTAEDRVRAVVEELAVPAALEYGATIIDGGTDSGVMRLVGRAHGGLAGRPPLVGVVVSRLVDVPGRRRSDLADDAAAAEPHHTHLVLVPGERWGDESPWLSAVAGQVGAGRGAVTLMLNGGAITLEDVKHSVAAGRPAIAVAGSGRTADLLAAAVNGDALVPGDALALAAHQAAASGLVTVLDPARPRAVSREMLSRLLRAD